MNKIDFSNLIITNRKRGTTSQNLQGAIESDRGRIINSAAVRRLQQKTQVFPLERNAAVRSRLTHSLEVQQVGRHIVQQIEYRLGVSPHKIEGDARKWFRAIESIVEMSCLMHDIGNPPFGHFGEKAISDWFAKNLKFIFPKKMGIEEPVLHFNAETDLSHFEGNAQGIRIVTSLLNLNLTFTQLASLTKYTRPAYLEKKDVPQAKSYLMKKPGFYLSEKDEVEGMYSALKMEPETRHFTSYIMEAADDISYCFADIEDSVEKNILSVNELLELLPEAYKSMGQSVEKDSLELFGNTISFNKLLTDALDAFTKEPVDKNHQFFISLRVQLQHILVGHAAKRFVENIEDIIAGTFNEALLEDDSPAHYVSEAFKKVAIENIFCHPEVEMQELRGYRIINGLLDYYLPVLSITKEEFVGLVDGDFDYQKKLPLEQRLINKLPNKHLRAYKKALEQPIKEAKNSPVTWEKYCRCRLIQDFISGMTDQFAYDEFKALNVLD